MKYRGLSFVLVSLCLAVATVGVALFAAFAPAPEKPGTSLPPKHMESKAPELSSRPESTPSSELSKPAPKPQQPPALEPDTGKVAYLTFDDGPTPKTPEVLQILKDHQATATFFTVFRPGSDLYYQQIADSGCQLALHAYRHDYKPIYASVESYFADFYKMQTYLLKFTETPVTDFRFPGGSSQTVTDERMFCRIILETEKRGLRYFDWNVSAGDATNEKISAEYVYNNIIPAAFRYDRPVILMHERSPYTRAALPGIIEALKEKGYSFGQVKDLPETVQHRTPEYAVKVLAE
jgi:peptidoglycan/xylan/chitin deacetylase (PgdA/CDA1 family)